MHLYGCEGKTSLHARAPNSLMALKLQLTEKTKIKRQSPARRYAEIRYAVYSPSCKVATIFLVAKYNIIN